MKKSLLFFLFLLPITVLSEVIPDSIITSCYRNFLVKDQEIWVTIKITKPEKAGFARIYEKFPESFTIDRVSCGKAVFKSEKNLLKIVWDDIPSTENLEISYRIKLKNEIADTFSLITGTFSAEFLPAETDQIRIENKDRHYEKSPIIEPVISQPVIANNLEEKNKSQTTTQPLAASNDTYFCIQVAAVGKNVGPDYLKKTFGFNGEFESHYEENIYRITVGKFISYTEAEAVLADYKEKYFKKCFMSAYSNGHKIPIYEAKKLLQ